MKIKRRIAPGMTIEFDISVGEVYDLLSAIHQTGTLHKEVTTDAVTYSVHETQENLLKVAVDALHQIIETDWEEEDLKSPKKYKIVEQ